MAVRADLTDRGAPQNAAFSRTESAMVIAREQEVFSADEDRAGERQSSHHGGLERAERPHEAESRRDKPLDDKNDKKMKKKNLAGTAFEAGFVPIRGQPPRSLSPPSSF